MKLNIWYFYWCIIYACCLLSWQPWKSSVKLKKKRNSFAPQHWREKLLPMRTSHQIDIYIYMAPTIFLADNYQKLCVWLIINVIIKNFIIFSRQFQEAIKEEEQNKSASICFWLRGMSSTSSTRPRRVLIPPPTNNDASFSPRRSNRIKVFFFFFTV